MARRRSLPARRHGRAGTRAVLRTCTKPGEGASPLAGTDELVRAAVLRTSARPGEGASPLAGTDELVRAIVLRTSAWPGESSRVGEFTGESRLFIPSL